MRFARKQDLVAAAIAGALVFSADAQAVDGVYIGVGAGQVSIEDNPTGAGAGAVDIHSYKGYKAFVGYRFGVIPLLDLALEAAYTDFGRSTEAVLGQTAEYKLHGPSAAGLVIVPIGPFDAYGKLGAFSSSSEKSIAGVTSSETATRSFYGLGVGFRVFKLGFRAEWERFDVPNVDRVQMYSVNMLFQF